jgi:hypothetical protein
MTDWNKFNPAEFDERQKIVKQKGALIALAVFAMLSGINIVLSDIVRWADGIGVVVLLMGISMAVYQIYCAVNGGFMAANAKELGSDKMNLVLPVVILGLLIISIFIDIIDDGNIRFTENGILRTSSMMMISSALILGSMIIATLIYRSKTKNDDNENDE